MSFKWTKQEEDILKKMIAASKTPDDIARVLKSRTLEGIKHKSDRMGLNWSIEPDIDFEAFKKMMGK
jgi:hypothetical protein